MNQAGREIMDVMMEAARIIDKLRSERKEIAALCRRHNHPGVNVGAHALASEVLAIIERGEA